MTYEEEYRYNATLTLKNGHAIKNFIVPESEMLDLIYEASRCSRFKLFWKNPIYKITDQLNNVVIAIPVKDVASYEFTKYRGLAKEGSNEDLTSSPVPPTLRASE